MDGDNNNDVDYNDTEFFVTYKLDTYVVLPSISYYIID